MPQPRVTSPEEARAHMENEDEPDIIRVVYCVGLLLSEGKEPTPVLIDETLEWDDVSRARMALAAAAEQSLLEKP